MSRPIGLEPLMTITFIVPHLDVVGDTPYGKRMIGNVPEGYFEGEKLRGTIQPPTGDWVLLRADGAVQLDVRATLLTDDDVRIFMSYQGLRVGEQSVLDRIAAGDDVDPSEYYMRTLVRFEAPTGKYDWLNSLLAVSTGQRFVDKVVYDVYELT